MSVMDKIKNARLRKIHCFYIIVRIRTVGFGGVALLSVGNRLLLCCFSSVHSLEKSARLAWNVGCILKTFLVSKKTLAACEHISENIQNRLRVIFMFLCILTSSSKSL